MTDRDKRTAYVSTEKSRIFVEDSLVWIKGKETDNSYINNLKTVCAMEYVTAKQVNILVSLVPTFKKELNNREIAKNSKSEYVGEIGETIFIFLKSVECVNSYTTFGGDLVRTYKIVDQSGNVYVWSTQLAFWDNALILKAKVKEHRERNGIKETRIHYCKSLSEL